MKLMRMLGVALVLIAVVAAIVPPLYNCSADGKMLTTTAGKQVPMKCYWTAQASIAAALPLGLLGLVLAFAKRRETQRALAVVAAGLGVTTILLPTSLIGTCASYDMICNLVLKPTMLGLGVLTIIVAAVVFFLTTRPRPENAE